MSDDYKEKPGINPLPDEPEAASKEQHGSTAPAKASAAPAEELSFQEKENEKFKRERLHISDVKNLKPWQRAMLYRWSFGIIAVALVFLAIACGSMYNAGKTEVSTWYTPETAANYTRDNAEAAKRAAENGATEVTVGTYVTTVNSVSIKNSNFNVVMRVWFKWDGDPDLDPAHNFTLYKGSINKSQMVNETTVGDTHYQLIRIDATINKVYYTSRFPLESHQLRIYVESDYPSQRAIYVPDYENSTINSSVSVAGYEITDTYWGLSAHEYDNTEGNPALVNDTVVTSEYITAISLERSGFGLFFKCFIAMYGTTVWVLIMLYICGHHRVDPLGMIPGALFGTVSNIMVGAALLPDALDLGLLEFVNVWGIMTIVSVAVIIIVINNIRSDHGKKDELFARFFGRAMFYVIGTLVVIGNIAIPLTAFLA